jgi:hypothetical protein
MESSDTIAIGAELVSKVCRVAQTCVNGSLGFRAFGVDSDSYFRATH